MDQEADVEWPARTHNPPSQPMTGPPMARPRAQARPDPYPFRMPQEWAQHQAGLVTPPAHQTNPGRMQAVLTQEYANNLEYQAYLVRTQLARQAREQEYAYSPMQTQMQQREQMYNDMGAGLSASNVNRNFQVAAQPQPSATPGLVAAQRALEQTTINLRMMQGQLALEEARQGGLTESQQLSFQYAQRQVIDAKNAVQFETQQAYLRL